MKTEDEMRMLLLSWRGFKDLDRRSSVPSKFMFHIEQAILGKRRVSSAMANALGYQMKGRSRGVRTYHKIQQ